MLPDLFSRPQHVKESKGSLLKMQIFSCLFPEILILAEARDSSFDQSESHTGDLQIALSQNVNTVRPLVHVLITVIFPPLSTLPSM